MEFGNTHKRKKSCVQQQPVINEIVTDNTDYISTLLPIVSCVIILGIIYLLYKDLQKTKADMYVVDQNIKHILSIINKREVIKEKPIIKDKKTEEKIVKFEEDNISKVSLEDTDSEDDEDDVIELVAN